MPAPPQPAEPPVIDLDPDDLLPEPEERTTSQTRRLGSAIKVSEELSLDDTIPALGLSWKQGSGAPPAPGAPETSPEDAPQPTGRPYLAGDVIDEKYRLTRIIGRGGMGAVWAAHNIPLDIDVAIKLIRRDRTAAFHDGGSAGSADSAGSAPKPPAAADRLLTEARAAARLMHPAIVRVFDFGETDQHDPFIVMELLRGESLNAILRRKKRLSSAVAVQTLLPVAAALASAHAKGIVHRDLKPDNIIVVTDESGALVPKIVDFGIAKLLSPGVDRQVTMAGEVLGSPDYMSPEQARGADNVGEATDIWAFSVMLYELVTGRRPFDGPNYNSLIASILTDDPAPITSHGVGDAALAGILDHGLAKETSGRWPRMRDMGAALASWAVGNGIEDDVMGNPIAKQWLSGAVRRLLTVQPETGEPPLRSGPVAPPGSPAPAVAPGPDYRSPLISEDHTFHPDRVARARRSSARRALLLVVAIVVMGAAAVAVFLARDGISLLRGGATAASASADAVKTGDAPAPVGKAGDAPDPSTSAASLGAPQEPSADAVNASASPSASPPHSGSVRVPGPLRFPHKTKAPAAPKNIKF